MGKNPIETIVAMTVIFLFPVTNIFILKFQFDDGFRDWQDYAVAYVSSAVLLIEVILFCYYLSL